MVPLTQLLGPSVARISHVRSRDCLVVNRDMSVLGLPAHEGFLQIVARRARDVHHILGIRAKQVLIREDHRDDSLSIINVRLKGYVAPIFALFYTLVSLIQRSIIL
jgi:hypothetical protein